MSIEERLRSRLADGLAGIDPGPGDRSEVERLGRRMRRQRRIAGGVAVLAVVALVLAVPRLDRDREPRPAPAPPIGGAWHAGASNPVGPRWAPVVAWTGTEVIAVGGGDGSPCPPNASCVDPDTMARDGAAYDPQTDTWRVIADAPVRIGYWFRPVVVGQTLVLYDGNRRWLSYSIADDTWSTLPSAPVGLSDGGAIPALDGRIYVPARSGRIQVLDVARGEWSQLPADDQEPRLKAYAVLPTDDGIFVCGADPETREDGDTPRFTVVDRWNGQAWSERFPLAGSIGNLCEHSTGTHLVSLDLQTAPGLDGDPPYGGRLDLETGQWSPLPGAPDVDAAVGDGWHPRADSGPLMAGWGYVYDDAAETWTSLGRPRLPTDTQQSAVWADDMLVVVGGLDEATAYTDPSGLSDETWIWTPR
jgi:hypothetical protein